MDSILQRYKQKNIIPLKYSNYTSIDEYRNYIRLITFLTKDTRKKVQNTISILKVLMQTILSFSRIKKIFFSSTVHNYALKKKTLKGAHY